MNFYRKQLAQYIDLEGITEEKLEDVLNQLGRDLIYNYFIFGKDVTFEIFLENLKICLNIVKKTY